jgi:hypothetical protein
MRPELRAFSNAFPDRRTVWAFTNRMALGAKETRPRLSGRGSPLSLAATLAHHPSWIPFGFFCFGIIVS